MSGRLCYAGAILLLLAAMPVPAIASGAGDSTGWHREGTYFSFEIPPGLERTNVRGIDSYVAEWAGERLRIHASYDDGGWEDGHWGARYFSIDGRPARLWFAAKVHDEPYFAQLDVRDGAGPGVWHLRSWARDAEAQDLMLRVVSSVRFPRDSTRREPASLPPPRHGWRRVAACGRFTIDLPPEIERGSIEVDSCVTHWESPGVRLEWGDGASPDCAVDHAGPGWFLLDGRPAWSGGGRNPGVRPGFEYVDRVCVQDATAMLGLVAFARTRRDRSLATKILGSVHFARASPADR